MSPIVPILAAVAAYIALRPARKSSTSSTPPEGSPAPEGTSPPPRPKPRPAKDSVYTGGGFKSPGEGDPPPSGGGGIVFEPPGSTDPDPLPDPKPPMNIPSGKSSGKQLILPDPIQWGGQLATENEPIEVRLSDQIDGEKLPDGTYYVRLSLTMELALPPIVHHQGDVYSWNTSIGSLVGYGQREVVTYKITVSGASGILQRIKSSQKKVGLPLSKFIFGCKTKEECGWNGSYNSYFEPTLVWNNGLEARFITRSLSLNEGINRYGATVSISFSRDPS